MGIPIVLSDQGESRKVTDLRSLVPSWFNQDEGSILGAFITAFGESDQTVAGDQVGNGVRDASDAVFVDRSSGADLDVLAANLGIKRPAIASDDDSFRRLIPILSFDVKCRLQSFYRLLTALYNDGTRGNLWDVYEVNPSEIIIELSQFGYVSDTPMYLYPDGTTVSNVARPYNPTFADTPGGYLYPNPSVAGSYSDSTVPVLLLGDYTAQFRDLFNKIKASGIVVRLEHKP